jgi:DNA-binding NarL/FixJ family response regulator
MTGIEALKQIPQVCIRLPSGYVSAMGQEALVREAINKRAKSFIVKALIRRDHIVQTLTSIAQDGK